VFVLHSISRSACVRIRGTLMVRRGHNAVYPYSDYVMGAGHTQSCIYDQNQSCFVTHISQQTYFHLHIVFRFCRVGSYPTYLTNLGTAPGCYSSDL